MPDPRFTPGQRVTALHYGEQRTGTVVAHNTEQIVWVIWDGRPSPIWSFAESLTILPGGK
jgi:hypothetical protein